jgi:ADP-ribose pyrophosphatase YjhB (NUDIX family)
MLIFWLKWGVKSGYWFSTMSIAPKPAPRFRLKECYARGSVEPGEPISAAVMREAQEETGLNHLHLIMKLGVVRRDMADFGLVEVQERHYFLLECTDYPGDTWIAYEETPSDGTQGPKPFRFFWVERDQVPVLAGGMDEMLANITWD